MLPESDDGSSRCRRITPPPIDPLLMKPSVMLDLETLGQKPGSVILALGAVKFTETEIISEFYARVDPESCVSLGLRMDVPTVMWWLRQSEAARHEVTQPGFPINEVLERFAAWIGDKRTEMWGNGAGFDNVLLGDAYDRAHMLRPWHFWNDRCYRTLKNIRSEVPMARTGTHHNALDDARSQAQHLIEIFARDRACATQSTVPATS